VVGTSLLNEKVSLAINEESSSTAERHSGDGLLRRSVFSKWLAWDLYVRAEPGLEKVD